MAEIIRRNKALSVSPIKTSQPIGASLAFLGINKAIPMMHGSQGCTAFGKVFFVRHFREPIPLQTTAMDQVASIMGADDNIVEGLKAIAEKSKPALIGLVTTGLSEMQGTDIKGAVRKFRQTYPEYAAVAVIPVNTPDFVGCLETGFSHAIEALLSELVPSAKTEGVQVGKRQHQVTILAGAMLTPSDVELLKETVESFGLRPIVLPDIGDSLDGHAPEENYTSTPLTTGGTSVSEISSLGMSVATLVIGHSLRKAGAWLQTQTEVPSYYFDNLMGLAAFDEFLFTLQQISGVAVPAKFERQRTQLQDAMLDTHFMLGQMRVAVAADPDELYCFSQLIESMGGELVAAVVPAGAPVLEKLSIAQVKVGDLEDLEIMAREKKAQLLIGNSHTVDSAERLGVPVLRASFPQYDYVGGYQRLWIGYKGTRQTLFDLANLMLSHHAQHEIHPYHSIYSQKFDTEETTHEPEKTLASSRV